MRAAINHQQQAKQRCTPLNINGEIKLKTRIPFEPTKLKKFKNQRQQCHSPTGNRRALSCQGRCGQTGMLVPGTNIRLTLNSSSSVEKRLRAGHY